MSNHIIIHSPDENKFFLMSGITKIGHLGYELKENIIYVDTTYVNPEFRNGFAGKKLVDECVNYARENNLKIKARCSFVVRLFEKGKRYSDVKV